MTAEQKIEAVMPREAPCYWSNSERDMSTVLLEPDGREYQVYSDASERRWWERGFLYVIKEDGERTYLIYS